MRKMKIYFFVFLILPAMAWAQGKDPATEFLSQSERDSYTLMKNLTGLLNKAISENEKASMPNWGVVFNCMHACIQHAQQFPNMADPEYILMDMEQSIKDISQKNWQSKNDYNFKALANIGLLADLIGRRDQAFDTMNEPRILALMDAMCTEDYVFFWQDKRGEHHAPLWLVTLNAFKRWFLNDEGDRDVGMGVAGYESLIIKRLSEKIGATKLKADLKQAAGRNAPTTQDLDDLTQQCNQVLTHLSDYDLSIYGQELKAWVLDLQVSLAKIKVELNPAFYPQDVAYILKKLAAN